MSLILEYWNFGQCCCCKSWCCYCFPFNKVSFLKKRYCIVFCQRTYFQVLAKQNVHDNCLSRTPPQLYHWSQISKNKITNKQHERKQAKKRKEKKRKDKWLAFLCFFAQLVFKSFKAFNYIYLSGSQAQTSASLDLTFC